MWPAPKPRRRGPRRTSKAGACDRRSRPRGPQNPLRTAAPAGSRRAARSVLRERCTPPLPPRGGGALSGSRSTRRDHVLYVSKDPGGHKPARLQLLDPRERMTTPRTNDPRSGRGSDAGKRFQLRSGRVVYVDLELGVAASASHGDRLPRARHINTLAVTDRGRLVE